MLCRHQCPDWVQYQHTKILEEKGIQPVVMALNAIIQRCETSEDCLHGYVRPLPNPKKDLSQIISYRIITLHHVYGIKLEKIEARKKSYISGSRMYTAECILPNNPGRNRPGNMTYG